MLRPISNEWQLSPKRLELAADGIHVWRANLEGEENVLRHFEETLSGNEKARAKRFFFQRDRNRFIAARGILRELLGRYVDRAPAHLEFDYGLQGKPVLRAEARLLVDRVWGCCGLAPTVQ